MLIQFSIIDAFYKFFLIKAKTKRSLVTKLQCIFFTQRTGRANFPIAKFAPVHARISKVIERPTLPAEDWFCRGGQYWKSWRGKFFALPEQNFDGRNEVGSSWNVGYNVTYCVSWRLLARQHRHQLVAGGNQFGAIIISWLLSVSVTHILLRTLKKVYSSLLKSRKNIKYLFSCNISLILSIDFCLLMKQSKPVCLLKHSLN